MTGHGWQTIQARKRAQRRRDVGTALAVAGVAVGLLYVGALLFVRR